MNLLKELKNLGLTDTQSKIYLALLKQKKATILQLARETNIQRPTIYDNTACLEKVNLITTVIDQGKKYLVAETPKNFHALFEQKQNIAKSLLPDLQELFDQNEYQANIKFFHGSEGLKRLAEVIPESKEKVIRTLANYKTNIKDPFSQNFLEKLWQARSRKHVKAKILFTHQDKQLLEQNKTYSSVGNIRYNREVRILPQAIKFQVLYTIVDDQVLFWSSKQEGYSFLFKSKSYADSLKSLFDYLWQVSEEFNS